MVVVSGITGFEFAPWTMTEPGIACIGSMPRRKIFDTLPKREHSMTRILITGMSGTGKSTVIRELVDRGHEAIDLDADAWSHWVPVDGNPTGANPGHDWMWREDKLEALLAKPFSEDLFLSGTSPNMGKFLSRFDQVVLLAAPLEIMLERLASRTTNPYGKRPEEVAQVKENLRLIEPRLREIANHEIDTSLPIGQVVDQLVALDAA